MRTPTDVLREEHAVILRALDALERAAGLARAGAPPPAWWWADVIGWLRAFADRNHHAKEEAALFPAMEKAGVPAEGGPIAVMLEEHRQGRALIAAMEAGGPQARPAAAREYVALLRAHIDKENDVLFPLAEAVLDERAMQGLAREFDAVEAEQGPDVSIAAAAAAVARLGAALTG